MINHSKKHSSIFTVNDHHQMRVNQKTNKQPADMKTDAQLNQFLHSKQIGFIRRKLDGKYLRGAKYWKWTNNWRRAAIMSPDCFRQYLTLGYLKQFGICSFDDIEILTEVDQFKCKDRNKVIERLFEFFHIFNRQ